MSERTVSGVLSLALLGVLAGLFFFSLSLGRVGGPLVDSLPWDFLYLDPDVFGETNRLILVEVRLPRTLLAVMTGLSLGLSGAVLQGLFRNPLADPGIIGTSSTASLGAVVVLYFSLAEYSNLALTAGGVAGALLGLVGLYILTGKKPGTTGFILAGVALSSLAVAMTSLALSLAPSPFATLEILFWMMGSVADRTFTHVWIALPLMITGWLLLLGAGRGVDALCLGEESATNLGFNVPNIRARIILGCALCVGAAVSVTGAIGFIGLVVPHILRPLVGFQPRALLVPAGIGGACLLLLADIAVRLMPPGPELKLGVLTALVGAPFFFWLLVRYRREML